MDLQQYYNQKQTINHSPAITGIFVALVTVLLPGRRWSEGETREARVEISSGLIKYLPPPYLSGDSTLSLGLKLFNTKQSTDSLFVRIFPQHSTVVGLVQSAGCSNQWLVLYYICIICYFHLLNDFLSLYCNVLSGQECRARDPLSFPLWAPDMDVIMSSLHYR